MQLAGLFVMDIIVDCGMTFCFCAGCGGEISSRVNILIPYYFYLQEVGGGCGDWMELALRIGTGFGHL